MQIGIFLDRDGTVNEEVSYLSSPVELRLIPGSADAIREANRLGLRVFIMTNQAGIARGKFTEDQLTEVHKALVQLLENEQAQVDAIYYCPHHPDFGDGRYRKECSCRKPNIGMLLQAAREFDIDIEKSFVVGDRMIDVQTGNNAGATSILVLTGYGKEDQKLLLQNNTHVGHISDNLYAAMQFIKSTILKERVPIQ